MARKIAQGHSERGGLLVPACCKSPIHSVAGVDGNQSDTPRAVPQMPDRTPNAPLAGKAWLECGDQAARSSRAFLTSSDGSEGDGGGDGVGYVHRLCHPARKYAFSQIGTKVHISLNLTGVGVVSSAGPGVRQRSRRVSSLTLIQGLPAQRNNSLWGTMRRTWRCGGRGWCWRHWDSSAVHDQ